MPRFFFRTLNGEASSDPDEEGKELADLAAAAAEARRAIADILKEEIDDGRPDVEVEVQIMDEQLVCISQVRAEAHVTQS